MFFRQIFTKNVVLNQKASNTNINGSPICIKSKSILYKCFSICIKSKSILYNGISTCIQSRCISYRIFSRCIKYMSFLYSLIFTPVQSCIKCVIFGDWAISKSNCIFRTSNVPLTVLRLEIGSITEMAKRTIFIITCSTSGTSNAIW